MEVVDLKQYFKEDSKLFSGIVCQTSDGKEKLIEYFYKIFGNSNEFLLIKQNVVLEEEDTITENLKFYYVDDEAQKKLAHLLEKLDFNMKIKNCSLYEKVIIQLGCGINKKYCVLDFEMNQLEIKKAQSLIKLIKILQDQFNVYYIFVNNDMKNGRYFDRLYVFNKNNTSLIPLKIRSDIYETI